MTTSMLERLTAAGVPAHWEQTGGGELTLVVPLPNGGRIEWENNSGWWYGVQDAAGEWLSFPDADAWPEPVPAHEVVAVTRALAARMREVGVRR